MTEHRANRGSAKDYEADGRRDRVTRESQQRRGSDVPECQRFPRFHADLPDRDIAFALEHVLDQVVVAERYAARGDDQVDIACLGEPTGEIRNRVAGDAKQADVGAPGASKRAEYE